MILSETAVVKKVLAVSLDQNNYSTPCIQSLVKHNVLTLFNSIKTLSDKEAAKEKSDANRSWFIKFEKSHLHNIWVHSEAATVHVKAANYPGYIAKVTDEQTTDFSK